MQGSGLFPGWKSGQASASPLQRCALHRPGTRDKASKEDSCTSWHTVLVETCQPQAELLRPFRAALVNIQVKTCRPWSMIGIDFRRLHFWAFVGRQLRRVVSFRYAYCLVLSGRNGIASSSRRLDSQSSLACLLAMPREEPILMPPAPTQVRHCRYTSASKWQL